LPRPGVLAPATSLAGETSPSQSPPDGGSENPTCRRPAGAPSSRQGGVARCDETRRCGCAWSRPKAFFCRGFATGRDATIAPDQRATAERAIAAAAAGTRFGTSSTVSASGNPVAR
jgi:hypothetical protein